MTGPHDGVPARREESLDASDIHVLSLVRGVYDAVDPVPAEVYERVRFAFDLAGADRELATLCETLTASAAVRGTERADTLTFESPTMTICVTIGRPGGGVVRLDGWLDPGVSMRVELTSGGLRLHSMSDDSGRFVFDGVAEGEVRLAVHPTPGSPAGLTRPVVTPPFIL
jgi:hypothetical protein